MIAEIYLAGGCFWGIEHLMKALPGVVDTTCGYANGTGEQDADYRTVCTGRTGFRETVRVRFDAFGIRRLAAGVLEEGQK